MKTFWRLPLLGVLGLAQNVGIGTATPTERLHVAGNLRFDGALMPNNFPGAVGNLLLSQGAGTPPLWLPNGVIGSILMIGPGGTPLWAPNPICTTPTVDRFIKFTSTTPTSTCNTTLAETGTNNNIFNVDGAATPVFSTDKFEIIATTNTPDAINGYSAIANGTGVYGQATGASGVGVLGLTNQALGAGVAGINTNADGPAGNFANTATTWTGGGDGVRAFTNQPQGNAVYAQVGNASSLGAVWAVNLGTVSATDVASGGVFITRQRGGSTLSATLRNDALNVVNYFTNTAISAYHMGGSSGLTPPFGILAQVDGTTDNTTVIQGQYNTTGSTGINAYSVVGYMNKGGASTGTIWGVGVLGYNPNNGWNDWAVYSNGWFGATNGKGFLIDHPLDPENKYLLHACAEGPEPYNIYRGVVTTDAEGRAVVELPAYYEALNRDPSYYLQPIGAFAQVIVEEEIHNNRFVIRTDKPHVKVSWMVVGTRNDPYIRYAWKPTEFEKSPEHRGKYLIPQVYGKDESYGIFPGPAKPQVASREGVVDPKGEGRQVQPLILQGHEQKLKHLSPSDQ